MVVVDGVMVLATVDDVPPTQAVRPAATETETIHSHRAAGRWNIAVMIRLIVVLVPSTPMRRFRVGRTRFRLLQPPLLVVDMSGSTTG